MNLYNLLNNTINFEQRPNSSLLPLDLVDQLEDDNEKELYLLMRKNPHQ